MAVYVSDDGSGWILSEVMLTDATVSIGRVVFTPKTEGAQQQ
jgi:hypothetical protein